MPSGERAGIRLQVVAWQRVDGAGAGAAPHLWLQSHSNHTPIGVPFRAFDPTRRAVRRVGSFVQPKHLHRRNAAVRESKVTVKIPRPLYRKVQQVVDGSGFNSPTDFIVYVLRDVLGEHEKAQVKEQYSEAELEDVKRKLKNLGYL